MRKEVEDLQAERDACVSAIEALPLTRPWAFEYSNASADPVKQTYLDKVDACDIFVIILGAEITEPVENEYSRACEREKRRLVFLKRTSVRAERLAKCIEARQDVTYTQFDDIDDLSEKVRSAIVDELIKGYRFYRLRDSDYKSIVDTIRSEPVTFLVRTIEPNELTEVTSAFPELQELYPGFEGWADGKRVDIANGRAEAYIADYGGENAGFALTSNKDDPGKVRKVSTLYIKPRYQRQGVGPRLLFGLIDKAARDGVEKLYITVSEERRTHLEDLLHQYGFFVEGVSGRRYRERSWEWVWSKRLVHGRLRPRQLPKFVRQYMFEERGFVVQQVSSGMFAATPRYGVLGEPAGNQSPVLVATTFGTSPERDYRRASQKAQELGLPLVFVSIDPMAQSHDYGVCIDGLDLEAQFFPLFVERDIEGLIVPIREEHVRNLIPLSTEPQFMVPTRIQLRTDNVYYRYPTAFSGLKRGSPLFFYETGRLQGRSRLMGEAKLLEYAVAEPEELLARYGNFGVYTLDDVRGCVAHRGPNVGKGLALRFDWYRELSGTLSFDQIRQVLPTFDPRTARRIGALDILELRRLAGWNVNTLSLP
jgi:GNAT superfamily N-acetyltransferase